MTPMPAPAAPNPQERDRLLSCVRRVTPGPAAETPTSEVLDEVLSAYGELDIAAIWQLVDEYARAHSAELQGVLDRQMHDRRRPRLLSDPALLLILERLEHDRYALRRSWVPAHDPQDLRRLADLWGVRLGI
jgi:hypothetical protein